MLKYVYFLLLATVCVKEAIACTSIAIGKDATVDGLSCVVTHTMDEANNDFRLVSVPARDYPENSKRPVYRQYEPYPRFVGSNVSSSYAPMKGQALSEPIGYIDQVSHTYGRYEASYGSMNSRGVSITESTCGAKTIAHPVSEPGGKALFWIGELSRIALERCATSKCAIETMGKLSVRFGFYGEAEVEGSGESLLVADSNEAWIFHILSSPNGQSAIWCARRVPDDSLTVVANMFTIREVNLTSDSFLYSDNMLQIAKEQGWWNGVAPFDFTAAFSSGEYAHEYYTGRRVWRVLSLAAPSLRLDPSLGVRTDRSTYPWSVVPDAKISVETLRTINRDHYEGTPFDLTQGMAAGPFGSPNRLDGGTRFFPQPRGAWERPIAMYRTSYSLIIAPASLKSDGETATSGVLWYAPHNPHASAYVPFFQAAAGHPDSVPTAYSQGSQDEFSFGRAASAWWATSFVMNWMDKMYSFMRVDVAAAQKRVESDSDALVEVSNVALRAGFIPSSDELAKISASRATAVAGIWWELAGNLTRKYNDGYINIPDVGEIVGYPGWWLQRVGYTKFPEPPPARNCT